ncbi:MAG: DNA-3-methyladenine glycosylase I [bacterium]
MKKRCDWAGSDPLYVEYHDREWGVPVRDDQKLFEFLTLEGFQAGLSWLTILRKRENFRAALDEFDYHRIVHYDEAKINALLNDTGIIRNQAKVRAVVSNARAFLETQQAFGSFSEYIWQFVDGKPIINQWTSAREIPAETALSKTISKDLKQRGFKFVGPTIVYAHMQATGMVNDHLTDCFRYRELTQTQ